MNNKPTGPVILHYAAAFLIAFLTSLSPVLGVDRLPNWPEFVAAIFNGLIGLKLLAIHPPRRS